MAIDSKYDAGKNIRHSTEVYDFVKVKSEQDERDIGKTADRLIRSTNEFKQYKENKLND